MANEKKEMKYGYVMREEMKVNNSMRNDNNMKRNVSIPWEVDNKYRGINKGAVMK